MTTLGLLHPGEMGAFIGAVARHNGHTVCWASEGRSPATHQRAAQSELVDRSTLAALCQSCEILLSVCPPHAAEALAGQVLAHGFRGLYADLNAIAPERTLRIAEMMAAGGCEFVDGGIVGGPDWTPDATSLYLSGAQAGWVAACFAAGPLFVQVLGPQPGQASALKMCYAAYTKGTTALLCTIQAAAESLGVRAALAAQWERDEAGFPEQAARRAARVTRKAWRFAGEMEEIAATFESAGLPGGFHHAAAKIYRRLAHFKDALTIPELEDVLSALVE